MYFDILNRSGTDHEYDRQTDGQTDGLIDITIANAAHNYIARPKKLVDYSSIAVYTSLSGHKVISSEAVVAQVSIMRNRY